MQAFNPTKSNTLATPLDDEKNPIKGLFRLNTKTPFIDTLNSF